MFSIDIRKPGRLKKQKWEKCVDDGSSSRNSCIWFLSIFAGIKNPVQWFLEGFVEPYLEKGRLVEMFLWNIIIIIIIKLLVFFLSLLLAYYTTYYNYINSYTIINN